MAERKAVIKSADMSEDMQQDAVDCASQALEKYNIEKVGVFILFVTIINLTCFAFRISQHILKKSLTKSITLHGIVLLEETLDLTLHMRRSILFIFIWVKWRSCCLNQDK